MFEREFCDLSKLIEEIGLTRRQRREIERQRLKDVKKSVRIINRANK
ncbi:hypothetical protein [Pedobacter cryoconitis]|nr:hypothetical protein [Pedobacter cryoconitis]